MTALDDAMEELTEEECWSALDAAAVGRLAVDVAGQPDIFPVNFVVDGGTIVFRTAAGTKLAGAVLMRHVAFEIDGYLPHERVAWSVVVKGVAREVDRMEEHYDAEELPLFPWFASPKPTFVRIEPRQVTGRRFHVVDDVSPDASVGWSAGTASGEPTPGSPAPGAEYHRGSPYMPPD